MKKLVLFTLLALIVGSALGLAFSSKPPITTYTIATKDQPTIGFAGAPVHIVVFEEPKCTVCAKFSRDIFPKIKTEYIDTHKVLYTVIPVSFLPNSMPAALALLCTYHQDESFASDNLFFTLLEYMYTNQPPESENWATLDNVIAIAQKASPAIDTVHLAKCIRSNTYKYQILENTNYGQQLLGGRLTTPSVFINGKLADHGTLREMRDQIEKAIKEKEGNFAKRTL